MSREPLIKFYKKNKNMPKKKSNIDDEKKGGRESTDEESMGEDSTIDPSIIEDTFSEEFSEYNDVDNY